MSAASSKVNQWREKYANSEKPGPEGYMKLVAEVADLLVDATLIAVFGTRVLTKEVTFIWEGQPYPGMKLGTAIKGMGKATMNRIYHPLRMIFSAFDFADLNQIERENSVNIEAFKAVVTDMIRERRAEIEDPACTTKNQVDFLT